MSFFSNCPQLVAVTIVNQFLKIICWYAHLVWLYERNNEFSSVSRWWLLLKVEILMILQNISS